MQFNEINICQFTIFRLFTVYNKYEIIKIDNKTREKSQVLSQVLEKFYCRLYFYIHNKTFQSLETYLNSFIIMVFY